MKSILLLILGISCFATFGNSQDGAEALPYGPAATAYDTQGNVAYNRTQADRELARAAAEARKQKELMYSRAAQSGTPHPPPPRTAAEFLAANKPPPAPPSDTPRPPIRRGRDYVPPFEGAAPQGVTAPTPVAGLPKKEGGLFKFFQSKKKNNAPVFEAPVGASDYQNPYHPEAPAAGDETSAADAPPQPPVSTPNPEAMNSALQEATVNEAPASSELPVGNGKPGFFSKLFGRKKPEEVPAGADPLPVATSTPPTGSVASESPAPPVASNEIPDPASFDEPAPPAPTASQPAPIFQRRTEDPPAGTPASVVRDGSATVNGVKVKLYQGGGVNVLSSGDGISRIQLPDGRVGTISSSYLSQ
ncbi:MAG: hypothetical protein P1U87_08710 [Verrucomicrobiales bacterium]|nr:hypothetical protein [Verrucomicrobiales bacterium]